MRPGVRLISWCTAALALPSPSLAVAPAIAPYAWTSVAIHGGGFVSGLVYHPRAENLLYARTDVGGAFRWDPSARRWIPLNDDLGREQAELLGVVSLALDARDAQRVYLACGSYLPAWARPAALLASSDQGKTWTTVPLPFRLGGNADGRSCGERLQVDPLAGEVLYLGTNQDGLWRSGDRGQTWQRVTGFPAKNLTFVLIDPMNGKAGRPSSRLYAGASTPGRPALYWSADAGISWSPVPGQPRGLLIQRAALDARGAVVFTLANALGPNGATLGAVWRFDPADRRWTDLTPLHPDPSRRDTFGYAGLALDSRQPGTLLVATLDRWTMGDEIFRSVDGGATWKPTLATATWDDSSTPYVRRFTPHWIGALALDPFDPDQIYFGTGYGVWATRNATARDHEQPVAWVFADDGMEETVVSELVSPASGAPLVSALGDIGGFRHDELNRSPARGAFSPPFGTNPGLAGAPGAPAKLVRTHSGPARGAWSADGGLTWSGFAAAPPPALEHGPGMIALSCNGQTLVWLPKQSKPYYSTDKGATWIRCETALVSPANYRTVGPVADPVNPNKFYIYDPVAGKVYCSVDSGRSFRVAARLSAKGGKARCEPEMEGRVWVPTSHGLFRSVDSGKTFQRIAGVEAADQVGFGRPAPGRSEAAVYLAGRIGELDALFRSDDGGVNWVRIDDAAHRFGWLNALIGDPRIYGRVYLGTGGRGIVVGEPVPSTP